MNVKFLGPLQSSEAHRQLVLVLVQRRYSIYHSKKEVGCTLIEVSISEKKRVFSMQIYRFNQTGKNNFGAKV